MHPRGVRGHPTRSVVALWTCRGNLVSIEDVAVQAEPRVVVADLDDQRI
jgi:hypothetical protein